ncbi:MAG: ABC transporter ATP-binding protein [Gammaproteobacteria bacterium]|nr:ABC transporter ATP-binding protein [Gammaproteobacteria bacterium]
MIQLQNICKTYHTGQISYVALREINLQIKRGEYIAILGPSGSGKSTLMQIIGCLSTPSSGSYILNGAEVSGLSSNELARIRNHTIGFVFQKFNLLPQLNIIDNVALPLVYRGTRETERKRLAQDILTRLGLEHHLKHRANELSGGQQQRVAIARALITDPEIILADEPTGNLDSKSGEEVVKIFAELHQKGKTLIMVTHNYNFAANAKRIVKICDGMITEDVENFSH